MDTRSMDKVETVSILKQQTGMTNISTKYQSEKWIY